MTARDRAPVQWAAFAGSVVLHLFTTSIFAAGAAHHLLHRRRATV